MIILATAATVIASQALVSGAFTLVEQGIALNLIPRTQIIHTSNRYPGQVYAPAINVLLAIGCVALVVAFRTSGNLAAAYGLAVSLTMAATTILFYAVIRGVLHWHPLAAGIIFAAFLCMDGSFVIAGLGKIPNGGWLPLILGAVVSILASTWYVGRRRLAMALASTAIPVAQFLAEVHPKDSELVDGTAVFLTGNPDDIPHLLRHHWLRLQAAHERIVLLTIVPGNEPYVDGTERATVERLAENLVRVQARFGFMELLDLKPIMDACAAFGLQIGGDETCYIVPAPQIVKAKGHHMWAVQRGLFDVMRKLSGSIAGDLRIPSSQLVELGVDVPV